MNDRSIIESLLFANGKAINLKKLEELTKFNEYKIKEEIKNLNNFYDKNDCSFQIIEVNNSFQLIIKTTYYDIVSKLFDDEKEFSLSNSQIEVLSIIAYNQNITKAKIEKIRGINSDHIIKTLIDLDLIDYKIDKNINIRSKLYYTKDEFLKRFGMKNIDELPKLED